MGTTTNSPPRVQVYTTSYCGYCRSAENLLNGRGIPFESIDVTDDAETRASLVERAHGRRTTWAAIRSWRVWRPGAASTT